jgi:hypothetical protein
MYVRTQPATLSVMLQLVKRSRWRLGLWPFAVASLTLAGAIAFVVLRPVLSGRRRSAERPSA